MAIYEPQIHGHWNEFLIGDSLYDYIAERGGLEVPLGRFDDVRRDKDNCRPLDDILGDLGRRMVDVDVEIFPMPEDETILCARVTPREAVELRRAGSA